MLIKWVWRSMLFVLLIGGLVLLWVDHQIAKTRGTFTEVIDTKGLYHTYSGIVIRNVHTLAPDGTHFIPNQNVVLKDGMITSIKQDSVAEKGLMVVEGKGKYLIPGLVDSHVHLRHSKNDLFLYLANGVTGIREMSGNLTHLQWKEEIQQGALGPRMYVASEKVNSKSGLAAHFETWTRARINYATEDQAAKKIQALASKGFDAVKIGSFINREMYAATIRQAGLYQLPAIGHIPYSVGLDSIYHSGQAEVAHIEELTKGVIWKFGGYHAGNADEFLRFMREQSDDIAIQLLNNKISVTSTLSLMESLPDQKLKLESVLKSIPLEYVNPAIVKGTSITSGWLPGNNHYEESEEVKANPEQGKASVTFWKTYVEALYIMIEALLKHDVPIMAGTDTNIPPMVPGFSLHDELASLAQAGLSHEQVLYSATVAPGAWMQSNTGKIQEGYHADLVLLTRNPLEDIQNTRSIESVFAGQCWMDKHQITQILASIGAVNATERKFDITEFVE